MKNSKIKSFIGIRMCKYLLTMTTVVFVYMIAATPVSAKEMVTFEGSLQGAICTHYKQKCLEDEAHLAMEQDFVLVLPDGKHFFLPNLSRITKARYAYKAVRIHGEKGAHSIWVYTFEVKKGKGYKQVWSWDEQQKMYEGGGG